MAAERALLTVGMHEERLKQVRIMLQNRCSRKPRVDDVEASTKTADVHRQLDMAARGNLRVRRQKWSLQGRLGATPYNLDLRI